MSGSDAGKRKNAKVNKQAAPGGAEVAAPPQLAPGGGGKGATPSNTAPNSYSRQDRFKLLRYGVDSLYASYEGELGLDVEYQLADRKLLAQSKKEQQQALAQWDVGEHVFEVKDKGQRSFPYILEDNAFRICLSSSASSRLPLAYAKISADYLAHTEPEHALAELTKVVSEFGEATQYPNISRIDLYADFQTDFDLEEGGREAWVTRAGSINAYSVYGKFSGWVIGPGGPISARLYNKSLEVLKSQKTYLYELWKRAGWDPDRPVWRLEFQLMREVIRQLGIQSSKSLFENLGGLWGYGTQTWLQLTIPQVGDTNRARWPTHPLWDRLADVKWRLDDVPLTRKFDPTRIPSQERLFRMDWALKTSFGAVHGLTDYQRTQRLFQEKSDTFNASRCASKFDLPIEEAFEQQVRIKARRYNTLKNQPGLKAADIATEADEPDEVDRDALDYYRKTRGE